MEVLTDTVDIYPGPFENDRPLSEYEYHLNFQIADLAGQRLLDIGAGACARFAEQAVKHGTQVVSVNPNWRHIKRDRTVEPVDGYLAQFVGDWQPSTPVVAAVSARLPFCDESFDVVTSLYGVPIYLPPGMNHKRKTFTEIARVLKIGGTALIAPMGTVKDELNQDMLESIFSTVGYYWYHGRQITDLTTRSSGYLKLVK